MSIIEEEVKSNKKFLICSLKDSVDEEYYSILGLIKDDKDKEKIIEEYFQRIEQYIARYRELYFKE